MTGKCRCLLNKTKNNNKEKSNMWVTYAFGKDCRNKINKTSFYQKEQKILLDEASIE